MNLQWMILWSLRSLVFDIQDFSKIFFFIWKLHRLMNWQERECRMYNWDNRSLRTLSSVLVVVLSFSTEHLRWFCLVTQELNKMTLRTFHCFLFQCVCWHSNSGKLCINGDMAASSCSGIWKMVLPTSGTTSMVCMGQQVASCSHGCGPGSCNIGQVPCVGCPHTAVSVAVCSWGSSTWKCSHRFLLSTLQTARFERLPAVW